MLGRSLVIVGTPNQRKATTIGPATSILRISGRARHAQSVNRKTGGQNSGRPSEPRMPRQYAQRRRPHSAWSIAASPTATSIESDWLESR